MSEDKRSRRQRVEDEWVIGVVMIFFGWMTVDLSKDFIMLYPAVGHAPIAFFGYFLMAIGVGILGYKTWNAFEGRTLRSFSIRNFVGWLVGGIALFFIMDILDFLFKGIGFWRLAFWKNYPLPLIILYFVGLFIFSLYMGSGKR